MRHTGITEDHRNREKNRERDEAVSTIIEYMNITAVLLVLMIVMVILVNAFVIEGPADTLKYHAFVDIGNGVSTRIVDMYVIAPENGQIVTTLDLPDDVASEGYLLKMDPSASGADQRILVSDGYTKSTIYIGGIGATRAVAGNTTGTGLNRIT